jgi:CBS domain-containing protein
MAENRMTRLVSRYMTEEVMWTAPGAPLAKVIERMNLERIRHVLVVEPMAVGADLRIARSAVLGILSSRDVLRELEAHPDEGVKLSDYSVKDVMTPTPLVTIGPGEELAEAARLMLGKRISALPVLTDGEAVGIITTDDILLAGSLIETVDDSA